MTGGVVDSGRDDGGSRIARPAEGWAVVLLSIALALILAWAVDEPAYVNGRGALTDGLPLCALAGLAFGMLGPKLGWGRWTTHLIGAAFAGLLVPILAGWAVLPGSSVAEAFRFTASGTSEAYLDIVWRGLQFTSQEVHYVLVLGGLVWATTQFLGYAVFGHHRPLNGVVVTGLVLVINMELTLREQLAYLVTFTVCALFLLIRMHAFDERSLWVRRRIGDPSAISSLYLRGGSLFILVAILGSLVLTTRASSAPLAGAWDGVNDQLVKVGQEIGRLFPVGGDIRGGGGVTFGSAARILPRWFVGDSVAFTATVPADMDKLRWRAATYDTFQLQAWVQTSVVSFPVAADGPLLDGTAEQPVAELSTPVTVSVTASDYRDTLLLAPGAPTGVDRAANVLLGGESGWFAGVDLSNGRDVYTVTSSVLRVDDLGNRLTAASGPYPDDIVGRYTDVPQGALGPDATQLLATILARVPDRNPFRLAVAMQDYLHSDEHFTYTTDLTNWPCDASAVECFARTHRGYCLHYASTMAILLRAANPESRIPTRLVQGFLPGDRVGTTETVRTRGAHAWVEVYFQGYGWIPFDPTGGGVGRPSVIKPGATVPPASPTVAPSAGRDREDPTRRFNGDTPVGPTSSNTNRPGDRTMLILLTVLLVLLVLSVGIAAWIRGPRGEVTPEAAWRTMSRSASRFGFAPRPTQTVYEYATSLGELVPVAKGDLQTVADAKVETAYARVRLGGARLEVVKAATRRLRVSLLRLVFRRRRRPTRHKR